MVKRCEESMDNISWPRLVLCTLFWLAHISYHGCALIMLIITIQKSQLCKHSSRCFLITTSINWGCLIVRLRAWSHVNWQYFFFEPHKTWYYWGYYWYFALSQEVSIPQRDSSQCVWKLTVWVDNVNNDKWDHTVMQEADSCSMLHCSLCIIKEKLCPH